MDNDFKNLLKLLDDDNEQLAGIAMAELLTRADSKLDRILRTLQETTNPKMRKRIHQLQSAIVHRRKRLLFAKDLGGEEELSLTDGMLKLHLLWYDNDTLSEMTEQWNDFLKSIGEQGRPTSLERLLIRLTKTVFLISEPGGPENPEALCIGTILEEGSATDFMACIVAKLTAEYWGFHTKIVSSGCNFYLENEGTRLNPRDSWHAAEKKLQELPMRTWSDRELVRLISFALFTDAVATDSFRYIHTLGCCMSKQNNLKFLPYPYGGNPEDDFSRRKNGK